MGKIVVYGTNQGYIENQWYMGKPRIYGINQGYMV